MKKAIRYILWITGGFSCLLILLWIGLAVFVMVKKQTILEKARVELKKKLGGDATIGDMEVSFFHHFPNITIHLSKVTLRDSLWKEHHHDLLDAEQIYLSLAVFKSIFAGKPRLGRVYMEHGTVYLFTDSTGYSNTSALNHGRSSGASGGAEEMQPPDFSLADVRLVMEKQDKRKFFDIEFRRLDGSVNKVGRTLTIATHTDALIKNFSFNTEKGSFLKDKTLSGRFAIQYNTGSKIIQFNKAPVQIDGHPFVLTGRFFPAVKPDPFTLAIQTSGIAYKKATALLTPLIQQKLDLYDIDKPIAIQAELDAGSDDDHTPLISVHVDLQHSSINTPIGRFNDVNVMLSFTNEWVRHQKRQDENSAIKLLGFSGTFMNMPLRSDTAIIMDLKHPMLSCDLHSSFELSSLNELLGSKSIAFRQGTCKLDIRYRGPMSQNIDNGPSGNHAPGGSDSVAVSLNGSMALDSATVVYVPYNFVLTAGVGKIRFRDQDLVFDKLEARTGTSKIGLKGVFHNFAPLIDQNPGDVGIDLTLSSPKLDLEDLAPLLGKPTAENSSRKDSKALFGGTAGRLDELLRDGAIHLQIDAAELSYQHFSGVRAKADLLFQGKDVDLKNMVLAQDDGSLTLAGTIRRQPGEGGNPLSFKSHIEQLDLPKFFNAFSNFGQDGITGKNLKGKLTADVTMTGLLSDKARMIRKSLKGSVDFSIRGGQLIDFEPMQKIHETVLKNRDMSAIHFAELKNQLDLDTTTLNIHRMEIQSTAFSVFVEGTYDLKKGPDLSLQVPLSNLKKDRNTEIPPDSKGNDGKAGLSVRLRARRGDDGKLKISWDPFKKALKKKK